MAPKAAKRSSVSSSANTPPAKKKKEERLSEGKLSEGKGGTTTKKKAKVAAEEVAPAEDERDEVEDDRLEEGTSIAEQERRADELLRKEDPLTCEDILHVLEVAPIPLTDGRKNVLPEGVDAVRGVALGAVTDRKGKNVVCCNKTDPRAKLTKVLCRFMKEAEPAFKFTTIQLNKNYAARRHQDSNNLGDSRLIGFGNFTGGDIIVEENGINRKESVKNRFVAFNGNNWHEVTEFTGTRYSIVFFTLGNYRKLEEETAEKLASFGFTIPTGAALKEYIDTQQAASLKERGTGKQDIKADIERLKTALQEEVKSWKSPAADEVQIVSGGYDVLTISGIARIETKSSKWLVPSNKLVTVVLMNPADRTPVEIAHLNFYDSKSEKKDQQHFAKLVQKAMKSDLLFLATAANTTCKQKVPLQPEFYNAVQELGVATPQRQGYRRPYAIVAYKGTAEEFHGERHELLRLTVSVSAESADVKSKVLKNMTGNATNEDEQFARVPRPPTFEMLSTKPEDVAAREKLAAEYRIVIPSYARPERLKEATLAMLDVHKVELERVFIFLADEEEFQKYSQTLGPKWKRRTRPEEATKGEGNLVVGVLRIRPQREFIARFFPEGQYLVSLDDDVRGIQYSSGDDVGTTDISDFKKGELQKLIQHGSELMLRSGAKLWSVNTSGNSLSMHPTHISRRPGVCNGYFYGFINRHLESIFPTLDDAAEDVERSARYFMEDGIVLRYRMIRCQTKCYEEKGGLQQIYETSSDRKAAELAHLEKLAGLYPAVVTVNEVRAEAQASGGDHRALPVHFLSVGAPPLVCPKAPWSKPISSVKVSGADYVTERCTVTAGRR